MALKGRGRLTKLDGVNKESQKRKRKELRKGINYFLNVVETRMLHKEIKVWKSRPSGFGLIRCSNILFSFFLICFIFLASCMLLFFCVIKNAACSERNTGSPVFLYHDHN